MARILTIALNPAIDISSDADHVRPTKKTRTCNQRFYAGGGGTNVARVIQELGGSPELLYLNGGVTGPLYDRCLEPYGLTQHSFPIAGDTRMAWMVHEMQTDFEYRFVPEGPDVTPEEIGPVHDFIDRFDGDYIVASGSLPAGAPLDTYARMAHAAERNGCRFVLDTSGDALKATLDSARIFLLKPSASELEKLAGERLDERAACRAAADLVKSGSVEHVAVSLGRGGAILAGAGGVTRAGSIHVREASAVGAGDSFVAGMVWWLSEGHSIEDAFHFGMAAGAAAVMTPGTELCRREDVLDLYRNGVEAPA